MEMMLTNIIELLKDIAPFVCCVGCFFVCYEFFYRAAKTKSFLFNGLLSLIVTITLYLSVIFFFKLRRFDYVLDCMRVIYSFLIRHYDVAVGTTLGGIFAVSDLVILLFNFAIWNYVFIYVSTMFGKDFNILLGTWFNSIRDIFLNKIRLINENAINNIESIKSKITFNINNQKSYLINSSLVC